MSGDSGGNTGGNGEQSGDGTCRPERDKEGEDNLVGTVSKATWSAVTIRGLEKRDERQVTEEEVERLQEVLTEALVFPEERLTAARSKWKLALIGKVLGRNMDSEQLGRILRRKWCPMGDLEIIPAVNGYTTFRFVNEEDFNKVRTGGPWMVAGAVLALEKWRPDFKPNKDEIRKVSVWLRMPGLPNEYWERDMLLQIASKAGRPVVIDSTTAEVSLGAFAKVCVEVDLSKPLVPGTRMGSVTNQFFLEFVYEGIGVYCYRSGKVGHRVADCDHPEAGGTKRKVAMLVDDWHHLQAIQAPPAMAVRAIGEGMHNGYKTVEAEVTTELYGPWMTVNNRRRPGRRGAGRDVGFGVGANQTSTKDGRVAGDATASGLSAMAANGLMDSGVTRGLSRVLQPKEGKSGGVQKGSTGAGRHESGNGTIDVDSSVKGQWEMDEQQTGAVNAGGTSGGSLVNMGLGPDYRNRARNKFRGKVVIQGMAHEDSGVDMDIGDGPTGNNLTVANDGRQELKNKGVGLCEETHQGDGPQHKSMEGQGPRTLERGGPLLAPKPTERQNREEKSRKEGTESKQGEDSVDDHAKRRKAMVGGQTMITKSPRKCSGENPRVDTHRGA